MTLIDSSAWIEYLRGTRSEVNRRVRALVENGEELLTSSPVAMELLAGARDELELGRARKALGGCRSIAVTRHGDWEDAAALYLRCRRAGVTPRNLIDCLIAAVAIRSDVPVLAQDRDFTMIAGQTPLRLA